MTVVPKAVKGKIVGFLLVSEKKGVTERFEFTDAVEMVLEVDMKEDQEKDFSHAYYTLILRDDNGEIEQREGVDVSGRTKIGESQIKKFCKLCSGNPEWLPVVEGTEDIHFECESCVEKYSDDGLDNIFDRF